MTIVPWLGVVPGLNSGAQVVISGIGLFVLLGVTIICGGDAALSQDVSQHGIRAHRHGRCEGGAGWGHAGDTGGAPGDTGFDGDDAIECGTAWAACADYQG